MTFLLSGAAGHALSDEVRTSIEGRGKVVKFAPQWKVLNHPAVGFFVVNSDFACYLLATLLTPCINSQSHLGSNSMQESILAGMPIVAFPFAGDQSEITQLSETRCSLRSKPN